MDVPTPQADALTALIDGLVGHIIETEDWDSTRAWVCAPSRIGGLIPLGNAADQAAANAIATMLARSVWNATPLPGNRFRPQPLPKPERNAPCPCGSGRKYKQCCSGLPIPEIDADMTWHMALDHLQPEQIRQAVQANAIPPFALAEQAHQYLESGRAGTAKALLEPLFEGDPHALNDRHEPALDTLCDVYNALGHMRKKQSLLERITQTPRHPLRSPAWQRLAVVYADSGDARASWDAFKQAQRAEPSHPALGTLEVTLLVSEGRIEEASGRARFWHGKLSRQANMPPEALEFLAEVAADPARAMMTASRDSEELDQLAQCIEAAGSRPLPNYTLGADAAPRTESEVKAQLGLRLAAMGIADDEIERALSGLQLDLDFDSGQSEGDNIDEPFDTGDAAPFYVLQAPDDVTTAAGRWRKACPVGKPVSVQPEPLATEDPWATDVAASWLALLQSEPNALDSVDVLDDLQALVGMHPLADMPGVEQRCLAPLLERGVAILDRALEQAPEAVQLPWVDTDNRPILRLLYDYALQLYRSGDSTAARARFRQYLALNPQDNHGVRSLLMDMLLRAGEDREALALCAAYPDDMQVEIAFGAVLAHFRLGDTEAATEALRQAHDINAHVVGMLRRARVRQPEIGEFGISMGGKEEAWLYREGMRDVWVTTDGLLAWARPIVG